MITVEEWRAYLLESRWQPNEPATEDVVREAERRIGVRLPPSFRNFLLTANGWHRPPAQHIDEVFPAERIAWFRDTAHGGAAIDAYLDFFGEPEDAGDADDPYPIVVFERALAVAAGVDHWLLDPVEPGPDGEWIPWQYQAGQGELVRFTSFADLFRADLPPAGQCP